MSATLIVILGLCIALAAANGANDVSKGVATLAGAGVTRYRTAIAWGVGSTLAGSLLSLTLASTISTLFTKGIVSAPPTPRFALAALAGAGAWVLLATVTRLPVSTTHAIAGALVGAGLLLRPGAVAWASLVGRVAVPLLVSVGASYALSTLASRVVRRSPECICLDVGGREHQVVAASGVAMLTMATPVPVGLGLVTATRAACAVHGADVRRAGISVDGLHWLTSGASSLARGLNDTPKVWALGAFALVPGTLSRGGLLIVVAVSIALGGTVAGVRVARRLAERVVTLTHREGFAANLVTAALIGGGATAGLPMSITHVATGAIAGVAGGDVARLNRRTLRDFILAWTATPLVAGAVAAIVYAVARAS